MNPPVQARQRLDLYIATQALSVRHAADVVLEENNGRLIRVGFRYRPDYIAEHHAFSIDPAQLPLREGEFVLSCSAGSPAFIDDYLPDLWGRRVLTRLAALRQRRRYDANSVIDSLALLTSSSTKRRWRIPYAACAASGATASRFRTGSCFIEAGNPPSPQAKTLCPRALILTAPTTSAFSVKPQSTH